MFDTENGSNISVAGFIALVIAGVVVKIVFWVWLCYRCYVCRERRHARRPFVGANTMVVNTSHVMSPVNHNHAGYDQHDQQQQWFKPLPQVQPQATASNSRAPPPYYSA